MYSLTEGALDKIMNGIDVEKPVFQVLGHKKLSSSSSGERYRLLLSDGKRINSFSMLATQLNYMITDNILTEYSICQINRYAISMVNNSGKQKRVMVILSLDLKVPGSEVGHRLGNPTNAETSPNGETSENKPGQAAELGQSAHPAKSAQSANSAKQRQSVHTTPKPVSEDVATTPIVALSPYQNRWVIKARVTSKSPIRTWSNSRGEGKLFSMDLVDESGEIRCTAFKDQCDKYYDMIEAGKVYLISRCTLKPANKQFCTLKNDYEMTLNGDSEIIPCHDGTEDIPTLQFNFSPISEIESKEKNDFVDILGVVKSYGDVTTVVSRNTGKELKKRDINIVDESNTMVSLTFWGTQAEEFDGSNYPIIAIKGARIGEFNGGKNVSTLNSSVVQIDPDIPEAHRLRGWFDSVGKTEESKSLSKGAGGMGGLNGPWITFRDVREQKLGSSGTADFYIVKANVNMIRTENALYKSCPTETCKKKLIDLDNGMYRCEKCDREFPNYKYRLLASANLTDWTGSQWVTAFNEEAEKLLGISAQELGELREMDNDAYLEKFGEATFKQHIFKLRVKVEVYVDEARLKTTCAAIHPMDYKLYNDILLSRLKEMAGIQS